MFKIVKATNEIISMNTLNINYVNIKYDIFYIYICFMNIYNIFYIYIIFIFHVRPLMFIIHL